VVSAIIAKASHGITTTADAPTPPESRPVASPST
jgi:hypothetical protein